MNCCNDYGQCNRNSDCAIRASTPAPFQCCPMPKKPAQKEIASDLFFYCGFIAAVATAWALVNVAWDALVQFSPKTVLMLQYLFQPTFDFLTR